MTTEDQDMGLTERDAMECRLNALRMAQDGFLRRFGAQRGAEVFAQVCPSLANELAGLELKTKFMKTHTPNPVSAKQTTKAPRQQGITYHPRLDCLRVRLDGKLVGEIRPRQNGYRYYPKGCPSPGEWFPTIETIKGSLESL